jgi:hypothetical protein
MWQSSLCTSPVGRWNRRTAPARTSFIDDPARQLQLDGNFNPPLRMKRKGAVPAVSHTGPRIIAIRMLVGLSERRSPNLLRKTAAAHAAALHFQGWVLRPAFFATRCNHWRR